jgi:hypothetical protein
MGPTRIFLLEDYGLQTSTSRPIAVTPMDAAPTPVITVRDSAHPLIFLPSNSHSPLSVLSTYQHADPSRYLVGIQPLPPPPHNVAVWQHVSQYPQQQVSTQGLARGKHHGILDQQKQLYQ